MKKRLQTVLGLLALLGLTPGLQAQLPVSRTTALTQTQLVSGAQFVGIPFTREPAARGVVTAQAGTTVTLSGVSGLNTLVGDHSLQVVTGTGKGRTYRITAFPSGTQATATLLPTLDLNVDEVLVIPHPTLDSLFPLGSTFTKNTNPVLSDRVVFAIGGTLSAFFYNSAANQWRNADNTGDVTNKGGTFLPFDAGMLVRSPAAAGKATVSGVYRNPEVVTTYPAGLSIVTLHNQSATTLLASSLTGQVLPNTNPVLADRVYLVIGGILNSFYFNSTAAQWRNADNTADLADKGPITTVPKGAAVQIRRPGATLGFVKFPL